MKPKVDRGKEMIKIRTEINAILKERKEGGKEERKIKEIGKKQWRQKLILRSIKLINLNQTDGG